jgi:DNA polymerase II
LNVFRSSQYCCHFAVKQLSEAGMKLHESDIKVTERFLMERFICNAFCAEGDARNRGAYLEMTNPVIRPSAYAPSFKVASIDIETEGFRGALYSIAVSGGGPDAVFILGDGANDNIVSYCATERAVLERFFGWLREHDPDVITGWNVIEFDLAFLEAKCRALDLPFAIGRGGERAKVFPSQRRGQAAIARVPGRVVLDGIDALRAGFWSFERFSLDHVSNELLGRGKLIEPEQGKLAEIQRLFREDKPQLAAYNLEDCKLVLEIEAKTEYVAFAEQRARLTGLSMERVSSSVAAFEFLYLPRLHRAGYAAPDVGAVTEPITSPGGYILDSTPGFFDNVLVLDFKSLYPSIIRTFLIDPLGLHAPDEERVDGFLGASFSRNHYILPELIESLWAARDDAKARNDRAMSQAIKIIMNSFYGVMGTPLCRFYDPKLATSITKRGHEIIMRSRTFLEEKGHDVIYGDTDSVFVLLGQGYDESQANRIGNELAAGLNAWWRETLQTEHGIESFLEVEFETHFLRFLMPTIRGSEKGTKKRYCGSIRNPDGGIELVFKGLESVRGDWTPLAKAFQRELYRRVFANEPFEAYVREIAERLVAGEFDGELAYRKQLRRDLADYTKNIPPHVRAARQLESPGTSVSYVITAHGPEPIEKHRSPIDYGHYLDRQLAPVADTLLYFLGTSFETITQRQMEMFLD